MSARPKRPLSQVVTETDRRFIDAALRLGRTMQGRAWPNPAVGTIVVQTGSDGTPVVVGRGATGEGGRPHAEEIALDQAGDAARGASVYVSLEPCAHRNRPGVAPCSNRLIQAGVARVFAAVQDPNPSIHGRGFDRLRDAGIEVIDDVAPLAGGRAHSGHFNRMSSNRPHVTLKLAVSADGMIGLKGGGQIPITGTEARCWVHRMRADADAILVGVGTVIADDPMLDCRLDGLAARSPVRVVFDTYARTPPASQLAKTAYRLPTWVVTAPVVDPDRLSVLAGTRIELLQAPIIIGPREDHVNPTKALKVLADRGITRVMVEGGSRVAATLLKANLVDEFALFTSRKTLGQDGIAAISGLSLQQELTKSFSQIDERRVGDDRLQVFWRRNN